MDPFLYVYGIGGIVFGVGLFYGVRQGNIGLSGTGLRNLLICVSVLAFFALLQGYQQYAPMRTAPQLAYDGSADQLVGTSGRGRGQPIDYAIVLIYFVAVVALGTWFGKRQHSSSDFFFGGQRFSWWLITASMLATTIGSYSFVKYSNKGFTYGLSSSQTYLNDWIWLPLLLFGWLPILYSSRVTSIPEYFGRRFGRGVRLWATICILIFLIGYVGVNLFTMGKVLNALLGWPIPLAALIVALISATYVTSGGQTSVIMTDLVQGVMLLFTGLLILVLGINYLGGIESFWEHLPRSHRLAFPNFNEDQSFPTIGIFWQDGLANSAMFAFLHQGTMMRYMAARSLPDSRKASVASVWILATIGACVVGGGGWVARALVHAGKLPATIDPADAFYVATELLARPGVFGLILAALTAALMSTVDTLITAIAAITVNDVYKLYVRPDAPERHTLSIARWCSAGVGVIGVLLVPLFMQFDSIYAAHGAFTAAITPPLVVTMLLSVFWRRFTRAAAVSTLMGGMIAIVVSLFIPEIITPFAQGVPMKKVGEGFLVGMQQYKYMRACFGLSVSAAIGVIVALFTEPEPLERQRGLVWGTVAHGLWRLGVRAADGRILRAMALAVRSDTERSTGGVPLVRLSSSLATAVGARSGDRVYISDNRWWLGGLYSTHAIAEVLTDDPDAPQTVHDGHTILMGPTAYHNVVTHRRASKLVQVQRSGGEPSYVPSS